MISPTLDATPAELAAARELLTSRQKQQTEAELPAIVARMREDAARQERLQAVMAAAREHHTTAAQNVRAALDAARRADDAVAALAQASGDLHRHWTNAIHSAQRAAAVAGRTFPSDWQRTFSPEAGSVAFVSLVSTAKLGSLCGGFVDQVAGAAGMGLPDERGPRFYERLAAKAAKLGYGEDE
jgi:hypothetical protein